ncbi:DegQ family serine endoprotease [Nitrospira sp. KM1]|uniref:DegQ family serine endoprotease n=1 Tax=Nitrospira sp. KM1 TaxID=1936990 RepID=UPI001E4493D4|nr:DegQ family serine endoprotease [Nitrospira sp. KM1]
MPIRRSWLVPFVLVIVGIVIGVVVASDLGWLPAGTAGPESPPESMVRPVATAPQRPMPGGDSKSFVDIAKMAKPAVVNIAATRNGKPGEGSQSSPFDDPFFRKFFGDEFFKRDAPHRDRKERGQGSGVIVDANGLIITNNHVVNKADEIRVILSDKREFKGKLIGTDTKTDIAVVKIEASGLSTIPWADSDQLEVGEFVLAVGSPFGLTQSVTMGIVSAVGRASMGIAEYEDFIQTDAAINPGNSGGALVNVHGELVGINTAIFSQSGGNMGIGFAVPSNLARSMMDQLVKTGKVVRGWLGVAIQELTPELASQFGVPDTKGVLVSDVMDDSPAKKAGFERADVIIEYDGKPMDSPTHLRNAVAQTPVGRKVPVKVLREKKPKTIDVTIVEQPKSLAQSGSEENSESTAPTGVLSDLDVRELNEELAGRYGMKTSERGVVVVRVKSGSPAEEMGVREGDMILEVNRKPVGSLKSYERAVAGLGKDQTVLLLLKRKGQTIFLTLKP